ncbi:tau 95 subunit of transcription factor TFIIIC [Podila horticola]|nr:tau 95 subunit of transcription factor TFIIIC [Podila horticola]
MEEAKVEPWPEEKLFTIEFPGHIANIDKAKAALGGERAIANAYLGGAPLDLRYRYLDPFSTPIQGQTVQTNNILLKATRRYKVKRKSGTAAKKSLPPYRAPTEDDEPLEDEEPQMQYEYLGAIAKTVRFSGLADYQHIVDPNDEIYKVKSDLVHMNYENLISVKMDNRNPTEDYGSLQIVPPVYISKLNVALPYKFRQRREEEEVEIEAQAQAQAQAKDKGKQKATDPTDPTDLTMD